MHWLVVAILIVLSILIIFLIKKNTKLNKYLSSTEDKIEMQKTELGKLRLELAKQTGLLNQYKAELLLTQGASVNKENEIARLKASIADQHDILAKLEANLIACTNSAYELKLVSDKGNMDRKNDAEIIMRLNGNVSMLNSQLDLQTNAISGLRDTIASQLQTINDMMSWKYQMAGPLADDETMTLSCSANKAIEVASAMYGGNSAKCGISDQTAAVNGLCRGMTNCSFGVPLQSRPCSLDMRPQFLAVSYMCK